MTSDEARRELIDARVDEFKCNVFNMMNQQTAPDDLVEYVREILEEQHDPIEAGLMRLHPGMTWTWEPVYGLLSWPPDSPTRAGFDTPGEAVRKAVEEMSRVSP